MAKKVEILIPSYVLGFKCIGGDCEDSCCIGWDIDIDKLTFRKYFRTQNVEMKKEFSKYVYTNEACDSEDVDYGRLRIKDNKWCPFLNDKKLCNIYTNLGEEYLSNVCHSYPRLYNILDGVYEMSLFMSCPEAVRQLMTSKDPIKFTSQKVTLDKFIVHSYIETKDPQWKNTPIESLKSMRSKSIKTIQNRKLSIEERLLELGNELSRTDNYIEQLLAGIEVDHHDKFQMAFFKDTIDSLHVFEEIDSPVFKALTKKVLKSFHIDDDHNLSEQTLVYNKAIKEVLDPFMEQNSYMFEHYLTNFMFQGNFPFTENQSSFDGYLMLVIRYTFLRFYLTGVGYYNGRITEEDVVELIQVYTKVIEHHKTFIIDLLQELKLKEFDTMDFITKLLRR